MRLYLNSIHDHWLNDAGPAVAAENTLPCYDVFEPGALVGHRLDLTLLESRKWVNPPVMAPFGPPVLEPLGGDNIVISFAGDIIDTDSPAAIDLSDSVPASGLADLDPLYTIAAEPSNVIYVLEWELSTDAPGVANSDTLYTLFSPDGTTPVERLHLTSLWLEEFLGVAPPVSAVPEASSMALAIIGLLLLGAKGRRWRRR